MTQNAPPNPAPPAADYQSPYPASYNAPGFDRDAEHLKILSVCWYVASGLALVFGCVPSIYIALGTLMISNSKMFMNGGGGPPPPAFMGWFFVIIGCAVMALAWTGSILAFITARSLPRRQRRVLCHVAAGLACLQIPVGLTLAVFTFITLGRPSIRASFH